MMTVAVTQAVDLGMGGTALRPVAAVSGLCGLLLIPPGSHAMSVSYHLQGKECEREGGGEGLGWPGGSWAPCPGTHLCGKQFTCCSSAVLMAVPTVSRTSLWFAGKDGGNAYFQ